MSLGLLWLVTGCYVLTALDLWLAGRPGLAWCFAGYALANLGMILEVLKPSS